MKSKYNRLHKNKPNGKDVLKKADYAWKKLNYLSKK